MNPHHRASGQPTSQVCQCHFTCMHCVRVGCFVKTLGLSPLCSLGVRVLPFFALHRSKQECKVCDANGARSAHVGLQYALCLRCMFLIEAFTCCVAFPVPQFTLVLSSQVRKESACSCSCCRSAKIGLLKTLRLVLRCAVRHSLSSFCRKQDKGSMHDTQCKNRLGWSIVRRRFVEARRVLLRSCIPRHSHDAW